jgi:hypothetical protein
MGGKGSGRRSHRPTLEEADVLELSIAFLRAKGMKAGRVGSIDYEDPEARFYAEIRYDLQSMPGTLRVSHLTRHSNPRERRLVEYTIDVSCVPSNLGAGELYLLHCPARPEIRATRLILPLEGARFLSPEVYGYAHSSSRAGKAQRLELKARKLFQKLGGVGNWRIQVKEKPPRMRRETFERLREIGSGPERTQLPGSPQNAHEATAQGWRPRQGLAVPT